MNAEILNAETERGRQALAAVMERSYVAEIESVPADWARVLLVGGVPVSFVVVDPDRWMDQPGGDIPYAFVRDVATRDDRRGEGHFRHILEHTFSSLRAVGKPIVITHGRYQLYRRFGFEVFTYHSGIFITPDQIERTLGLSASQATEGRLEAADMPYVQEDLLLVTDVRATTLSESKAALQAAASLARERRKARILFEHPRAPSYGSRYPIHTSLETPLTIMAGACGGHVCRQGADPEQGSIPDADWIKVLDPAVLLREALRGADMSSSQIAISFDTDAGAATVEGVNGRLIVHRGIKPDGLRLEWGSSALAQLVTGYRSVDVLDVIHGTFLSAPARAFLGLLFPVRWRLSRNESWMYRS